MASNSSPVHSEKPTWRVGSRISILLPLCRFRPCTDGTRGVSSVFRDQHDLAHPWRSCSDTRRERSVHTPPSRRLPSQQVRPSRYGDQGRCSRHPIIRSCPIRPPVHAGGWTPAPAPRRHACGADDAACQGLDRPRRARAALPRPVLTKRHHARVALCSLSSTVWRPASQVAQEKNR